LQHRLPVTVPVRVNRSQW